jgi:DNA-directed RNA polymerase subunit RPC12/RpoP
MRGENIEMIYKNSSKIKKPWLVCLLDVILPGLGFIYLKSLGSIIAGIIVMVITYYMNASPLFWLWFGVGIRNISTWTFWALIICAISVNITRLKNRKILKKIDQGHNTSQIPTEKGKICPSCGTKAESVYVFCAKCGESLNISLSENDKIQDKCPYCGLNIQSGDIFCGNCGNTIV